MTRTDLAATPGRVIAAFVTLYLVWGSTYLGIRIAVETLPPFLLAGARFVVAGAAILALRAIAAPRFRRAASGSAPLASASASSRSAMR